MIELWVSGVLIMCVGVNGECKLKFKCCVQLRKEAPRWESPLQFQRLLLEL